MNEADLYGWLTRRVTAGAPVASADPEADAGYAALGTRGAEIIRRTHAFHREVLAIFAGVAASDRARALDEAVDRYLSRPEVALPDVPKDMTILYDHPYTSFVTDAAGPRSKQPYPNLTGFVWATHWFQLAAMEPLELATDSDERRQGLKIVTDRFHRKLSAGSHRTPFPRSCRWLPASPRVSSRSICARRRLSTT